VIQKAAAFLRDVRNELAQVSWTTPQELWDSTKVVLGTMALLGLIIATFDFLCARIMSWMIR